MQYDFATLDSNDFENLTRDLLNARFQWDLQSFKAGKDKGIDLRLSTAENINAIVVQAKHYLRSGFSVLYSDLETKELAKVQNLNPGRYLLVTSISLNPQEKDKIYALLSPYLKSTNDIFGKEDLNKYLTQLPDIETKWYKLWLTSVPVMSRILHNGALGGNEFAASKIFKTIQHYVYCRSYDIAFDILKNNKYILITGQPGVGKTTLAYYLTYHLLTQNFQLLYVDTDILQASKLLSSDPSVKQVIFFDDFLGENYLQENRPKTTESAFVFFLERIIASENKYLILTTRTTIYNNALDKYEKLERMKVSVARKEIVLDQYSVLDKARILYKHLFFSDITEAFKEEIFADKNYWKIITHRNYNPRLIEFITLKRHVPASLPNGYLQFVLTNLHNPKEVWKYFYQEQLSVEERILLHVVFLQTYSAKFADTKMMFLFMLDYEIRNYNFRPGLNPFQSSLKRLLDGTLKRELNTFLQTDRIMFINPSLSDFLKHYFSQHEEERLKLLRGSGTIEQFEEYKQRFLLSDNDIFSKNSNPEKIIFANLLMDRAGELACYQELKREINRAKYVNIRVAALLNRLYSLDKNTEERIEKFCYQVVIDYLIDDITIESRQYYCGAIKYISLFSPLYEYVINNWDAIINALFAACIDEDDFEEIKMLFDEFGQKYSEFIEQDNKIEMMSELLSELADKRTNEWIKDATSGILTYQDFNDLKEEISEKRRSIFRPYDLGDETYDEEYFFRHLNVEEIIQSNNARENSDGEESIKNVQSLATDKDEDMIKDVEVLYSGDYDEAFVKNKAKELSLPF